MEAQQDLETQTQTLKATNFNTGAGKKCPYCPSEFRKADHFHRHVRSHTKEKPFRCHICRKAYARQYVKIYALIYGKANDRSDTLLRHTRIHKKDSNAAHSSEKVAPSEATETTYQDVSPASNFSTTSRAICLEGPVATIYEEQSSPGLYSSRISMAQTHQEDVQIPGGAAMPSFAQTLSPHDISGNPVTAMDSLHSETYGVTTVSEFQTAPSTLPPAVADSDTAFVAQSDCFSMPDPLGAHGFEELSGFSSGRWLLEDNFDFSIFEQMAFSGTVHEPQLTHENNVPRSLPRQLIEKPKHRPSIPDLRHIWYVQVPGMDVELEAGSGTVSPGNKATTSLDDIDETYRLKMANTLRPPLRDEPLPSIEFLNLCIHLFFTRFNVALPLVHGPTFRSTHGNALLVLSICSAGCLSLGSDVAARTGSMLFERVNKAILVAPWERVMTRTSDQTWSVIKAAMIGQTYALLSGDPAHRATAAAYHGSLIALARRHKLLSPAPAFHLNDDLSAEQLDKAWRKWARQEELRRVAVLLYIHDAEIAGLFHHETVFRHNAGYIPTVSSHELFSAPSAVTWATSFRAEQRERHFEARDSRAETPDLSSLGQAGICGQSQPMTPLQKGLSYQNMFNSYNGLSCIGASICESRHLDLLSSTMVKKFESDLLTWYAATPKAFKASNDHSEQTETPFSLLPLWHYNFITLTTNLNILEIAVGREGTEVTPSTQKYVLSWIASSNSKRCLLHALFLQNLIVSTSIGALVAIHTPRILFSAALCWYCYMLYIPESSLASVSCAPSLSDWMFEPLNSLPEIQLLRGGKSLNSANIYPVPHVLDETIPTLPKILAANPAEMKASTLCVIESILRRLGTSGISLRFADIIQAFISGETDKTSMDQHVNRQASHPSAA